MMNGKTKIRFTRTYRGRLTGEQLYHANMVAELPADDASAVIAEGAAELAGPLAKVDAPAEDITQDHPDVREARLRQSFADAKSGAPTLTTLSR
jgi:hypothetical protein